MKIRYIDAVTANNTDTASALRIVCFIKSVIQILFFFCFFFPLQFSVDGNSIVLSPELYITVLAYTSILNPEAPQVSFICCCRLNSFANVQF